MSSLDPDDDDGIVQCIHALYKSLNFIPQHSQFTILASFYLVFDGPGQQTIANSSGSELCSRQHKIISLATGTKCTPGSRLSPHGELVHDSHAEVLAKRGATRWLLEEAQRVVASTTPSGDATTFYESMWIVHNETTGKFRLKDGVKLWLYISTLPCGDASTRFIAFFQDTAMAALKDGPKSSSPSPSPSPSPSSPPSSTVSSPFSPSTSASRGRDGYSLLSVLRTKPGRADSPPTLCMSCSDKLARWNVLGIQGALGSLIFEPTYLDAVVLGEVPPDMESGVREDCERAFWGRVEVDERWEGAKGLVEGSGYRLAKPKVRFTRLEFMHSKVVLEGSGSSCNEAISWIAEVGREILINGLKRGVSPKHRFRDKSTSKLCRLSIYELCAQVLSAQSNDLLINPTLPYLAAKALAADYQTAKAAFIGPHGPFAGWIRTGEQYQMFDRSSQVPQAQRPQKGW